MKSPYFRNSKKPKTTKYLVSFPARFTAKKLHLALFNFVKKYVTLQQNLKPYSKSGIC